MQNKGYYAVQGHSRSPRLVSIESPYATSYKWLKVTHILSHTVSELSQLIVPTRSVWPKISDKRGSLPPTIFAQMVRPINTTLSLTVFTQRNFVANFLLAKCDWEKMAVLRFWAPFGGLGATYDDPLRLIGKRAVDFLLVLIKLFSLGVTTEALRAIIGSKSAISLQLGPVDPNFR